MELFQRHDLRYLLSKFLNPLRVFLPLFFSFSLCLCAPSHPPFTEHNDGIHLLRHDILGGNLLDVCSTASRAWRWFARLDYSFSFPSLCCSFPPSGLLYCLS
uniref:Putative secreted protein n=1 Tax=Anopheles darlingi TaxID=43151 RepID=A0A2M4D403_ANODA